MGQPEVRRGRRTGSQSHVLRQIVPDLFFPDDVCNVDGWHYAEADVPMGERPEIDRWILSELNTLVKNVDACYEDYEPTKAGR